MGDAPSQIFLITKDLSTLFFLSLVLASSYVRPSLCLLSVLSQLILNGFTCNRSLIENEFLSQIHSLIVDRVRKAFPEIILRSVPAFSLTFYRLHKHTLYINMKRKPNSLYPLLDYESDLEIHFQLSFDYR